MTLVVESAPGPVAEPAGPSPAPAARRSRPQRPRPRLRESTVVFLGALALYLTVAVLLDFVFLVFPADAVSRLANGYYVLFSRDPHLAALGFVWNPLTSIADLVPLLLHPLWPALGSHDVAASAVSALAMAGTVHQLRAALTGLGVRTMPRLVVVSIFALNPMSLYFGANGMSEGLYLFTLVAATRYLLEWAAGRRLRPLVYAGAMLGLSYLARNEGVAAASLAGVLVFVVGGDRSERSLSRRWRSALNDALIVLLPFIVTFVGWAAASFVITGSFFQQFEGNAVQVRASGIQAGSMITRLAHEVLAVGSMAPLLLVIGTGAATVAWRHHRVRLVVPVAVLGGGLAFDLASYVSGSLFPWYRYYILTIPLAALLTGVLLAGITPAGQVTGAPTGRRRRAPQLVVAVVGALLLLPGMASTYFAMLDPSIGQGETIEYLGPLLHPGHGALDRQARHSFAHVRAIADSLAAMGLGRGDVVVDNQGTCVPNIILAARDPTIFVIPNDRDYQRVLADPLRFGAHYLFVPQPVGINAIADSVTFAYPGLYNDGAGFSHQVRQFAAGGLCPAFRLFLVTGHPVAPGSVVGIGG